MDRRHSSVPAAGACILWGSIPLVVRVVDVPTTALVFSRVGIGAAGLALLLALQRGRPLRLVRARPGLCVLAAVVLAAHWSAQFAAYRRLPVAVVILILYLSPVAMAALARVLLGEPLERRTAAALALALAGFVVVSLPTLRGVAEAGDPVGYALAVGAAASYALLIVITKPLAQQGGAVAATFVELLGATVVLAPFALTADWGAPDPSWAWLAVLGLVHTAAATAVYVAALAALPVARVGVLGYLEPASAIALGWAFLGQRPSATTVVGGLTIVVAGMVVLTASSEVPARVPG